MTAFTFHARDRARERYGIELDASDFREIADACKPGGAAVLMHEGRHGKHYLLTYRGTQIVPVVSCLDGAIVTFAPLATLTGAGRRAHQQKRGKAKTKQASHRFARSDEYRRARERLSIADAMETDE